MCDHPHCQNHAKRWPLGKTHTFLSEKSKVYHTWHHHRHHAKVHGLLLGLHIFLMIALVMGSLVGPSGVQPALAASTSWDFSTAGDYTYDNTKIDVTGGMAQLKPGFTLGSTWIANDGSGLNRAYRKPITIDNSSGGALTNYQVSLTVDTAALVTASKLQSDCDDLIFADTDTFTTLSYWIEKGCNTSTTTVWVKVPSISASSSKTIYMYYGNTLASAGASGTNTFNFFDDFSGGAIDGTKWTQTNSTGWSVTGGELKGTSTTGRLTSTSTFSTNVIQETKFRVVTKPTNGMMPAGFFGSTSNAFGLLLDPSQDFYRLDGTWNGITGTASPTATDMLVRITAKATTMDVATLNYSTGAGIRSFSGASKTLSSLPIVLGERYDDTLTGQSYEAYWDFMLVRQYTATVPTGSLGSEAGPLYPITNPTITPVTGQGYNTVSAFAEALGSGSTGTIKYQISPDSGSTWYWWNGSTWAMTSSGYTEAVTAATVNTNISTFTAGSNPKTFTWKAYLNSDGAQLPKLDNLTLTYIWDTAAPPNPSSVTANNSSGGGVTLTTDTWYTYPAPYFSWSAPTDNAGAGEVASGIAGYYVYFGTSSTADPQTAGAFQVGTNYTASSLSDGSTYYLRFKTKDNAGNISAAATLFIYKYDVTTPTNPAFVSVSPAGYNSTNSFTFLWPSSGGNAASDAASGVQGYQYKTGASSGSFASYSSTTSSTSVSLSNVAYQEGSNVFFLRTLDNAGNTSSPITVTFYYNPTAPTAPQNVTATPSSSTTTNSFAFSWDAPATYQGTASELTYYYSVNAVPTSSNVTGNGNSTSLAAGPYATQQGDNTFYVVAKDSAGNINYGSYGSVTFNATTTAPGQPLNPTITDSSNRVNSDYRLSLTWTAPSSGGTVASYKVNRSTDNSSFSVIGTTTSTGYIDSSLDTTKTYYYKIVAVDDAGAASVASSIVSKQPTGKYADPPTITTGPSATAGATTVTITWKTDRVSDAFVEYGPNTQYGLSFGQRENTTDHTVKVTGLSPGTVYHYRVQSLDSGELRDYESTRGYSSDFSFETTAAPGLSNVTFSDITTNAAILTFETSKASSSTIDYGTSTNYGQSLNDDSSGVTTKHTIRLKDLTDGTTYQLRITIEDTDGNSLASTGHAFTTVAKPKVENVRFETLSGEAQTAVKVTWDTNVQTTGSVTYTSDKGEKKETASSQYEAKHEFIVRGLEDQRTYTFRALSRDQFGNEAISESNTVQTPLDTRPPKLENLTVEIRSSGVGAGQKAQLVVSWETDEPATSQIEYGPGISSNNYSAKSQEDATYTTNHVVIVSELEPSKLYHLRAVAKDKAGNAGRSADTTAITGKVQRSVIDVIINSLEHSLGFLSRLTGR